MSPAAKLRALSTVGAMSAAVIVGIAPFVARWEGEEHKAYRDIGGVITICNGHTETARMGQVRTSEQCRSLLVADLITHADRIRPCVPEQTPLEVQEASLSLAFNIGTDAFCRSTMARKLQTKDYAGACAELSRWVRVKGKVIPGLANRRAAERRLCESALVK